jgi:hypothetical protein
MKNTLTDVRPIKVVGDPEHRTFVDMAMALSAMDLGKAEIRERVRLLTPVYVVAEVAVTYGKTKRPKKMVSYGISRKGWNDKPNANTGVGAAIGRARRATVKKLRRKIPRVGGWYEA